MRLYSVDDAYWKESARQCLKTVKPTRMINKLKFIYHFTAEIHFSACKLKKYCLQENVNSNGTGKKSGHAQRDFCEAKILRRKTQK